MYTYVARTQLRIEDIELPQNLFQFPLYLLNKKYQQVSSENNSIQIF